MTKTSYIYVLREKGDREVRYVGQTIDPSHRLLAHKASLDYLGENNPKRLWINDVLRRGSSIEMEIIDDCDILEAHVTETYWMNFFREKGDNLTNSTENAGRNNSNIFRENGIMPKGKQIAISTTGQMTEVIKAASEDFPNAGSVAKSLESALKQWSRTPHGYIRNHCGVDESDLPEISEESSLTVVERGTQIIAMLEQMSAILKAMEQNITDLSKK